MCQANKFQTETEKIKWLKQNQQTSKDWLKRIEGEENSDVLRNQLKHHIAERNEAILKREKIFMACEREVIYRFLRNKKMITHSKEKGIYVFKGKDGNFTKLLSDFLYYLYQS